MKSRFITVTVMLFCVFASLPTCVKAETIAFRRNNEIWIADKEGGNQEPVCKSRWADISSDGRYIAFIHHEKPLKNLAYMDVETKEVHIFESVPQYHRYLHPKWSPDNNTILFLYYSKSSRGLGIAIADTEDTYSRVLVEGSRDRRVYAPTWGENGEYVLFHDLMNLYRLSLDGHILSTTPCRIITSSDRMSSGTEFELSRDANYLLFHADVDGEVAGIKRLSLIAVFVHDLRSGKTSRITPRGICALNPCWASNNTVLFEGYTDSDILGHGVKRSIYSIELDGANMKKLIEDASNPSFAPFARD